MSKRIRVTSGDDVYEGTAEQVVRQMKNDDWGMEPEDPKRDWMTVVSDRVYDMTGENVHGSPADEFLKDIAAAGLVTIEEVE